MSTQRYYDWQKTFSYQTGSNGEFCLICGGKGIGKTFGARLEFIRRALRSNGKCRFVEISRSNEEMQSVEVGYFDKLQADGYFTDFDFKIEKHIAYAIPADDETKKIPVMYFVSLSTFQREKRRTFANVETVLFDEFIIDRKDRYHRYLKDEFFILANILDTIFRQQADDNRRLRVYLLGNAVDFTNPYFQHLGINRIPKYGYSWFNGKHTLLHYVEPWDSEERKQRTLVGRLLNGTEESSAVFDNVFASTSSRDICRKPAGANYTFALKFGRSYFAVWVDRQKGLYHISDKLPKDAKAIYTLTRKDNTIDFLTLKSSSDLIKHLIEVYYLGGLRYGTIAIREQFLQILGFLGVK